MYRRYIKKAHEYCKPIYDILRRDKGQIHWLHETIKPLKFAKTKYNNNMAFEIDVVWCTLARVDIAQFYNIMRPRTFPQLCDFRDPKLKTAPNRFKVMDRTQTVELMDVYCAKNTRNTLVPLETIAAALYL